MRRYDDPVEVRRGPVGGAVGEPGEEGPEQFLWRGRLWRVRSIVAHWVETGAWWQQAAARAALGVDDEGAAEAGPDGSPVGARVPLGGDLLGERELWRVEAGRSPDSIGVFDLALDWSDGRWQLVGCLD